MTPADIKPVTASHVMEGMCYAYSTERLYTESMFADALEAAMDACVINIGSIAPGEIAAKENLYELWRAKISELRGGK